MQFVVNAVSRRGQLGVKPLCRILKAKSTRHRCGRERQVQVMIVLYVTLSHPTEKRMKARAFQSQARLFTCRILPYVAVKQTKQ